MLNSQEQKLLEYGTQISGGSQECQPCAGPTEQGSLEWRTGKGAPGEGSQKQTSVLIQQSKRPL